jgi:DNA-binding NarL/FixJ family response regulator
MTQINILIADDHKLFRDGIKSLLLSHQEFNVVAEASTGEELIDIAMRMEADIIITDISMPGINGIEASRKIMELKPKTSTLILSMYNSEEFVMDAIKAGAKGYLPKDVAPDELFEAIIEIANGGEYFSKSISDKVFKSFISQTRMKSGKTPSLPTLTERELEVVKLVAEGYLNKEIADKLNISIRTVDTHKNNILQKLKLKSTVELVKYAIRHDLIKI